MASKAAELEIGQNLIKHTLMFDFTDLIGTLQQMNKEVVKHATMMSDMADNFFELKAQVQELRHAIGSKFDAKDAAADELARRIGTLERTMMEELPSRYVASNTFTNQMNNVLDRFRRNEDKLEEVEAGDGARMHSVVKKTMDTHLNHWYNPIRRRERDEYFKRMDDSKEDVVKRVLGELTETEETLQVRIEENNTVLKEAMAAISEEKDTQIARLRGVQQTEKYELETLIGKNDNKIRKDVDAFQSKCNTHLADNQSLCLALYYTLAVPRESAEDLYKQHLKATRAMEREANAGKGPGSPTFSPIMSSPLDSALAGGFDPDKEDPRSALLHGTPPFLDFRRKVRKDIMATLAQTKEEDQDDFSKQLTTVHQELRKKPDVAKVINMIRENTDVALYDTVERLKHQLCACENDKVAKEEFVLAMRTKADVKVADAKADRAFVTSLFEYLRGKLEEKVAAGEEETAEAVRDILKVEYGMSSHAAMTSGLPARFNSSRNMTGAETGSIATTSAAVTTPGLAAAAPHKVKALAGTSASPPPASPGPPDADRRKKIDAALNPDPEFQWASQVQKRHRSTAGGVGVNPVKTRVSQCTAAVAGQQPGMLSPSALLPSPPSRPGTQAGSRGKPRSQAPVTDPHGAIASWAEEQALPPLDGPSTAPSRPQGAPPNRRPSLAAQPTRAHDNYTKAVAAVPQDGAG